MRIRFSKSNVFMSLRSIVVSCRRAIVVTSAVVLASCGAIDNILSVPVPAGQQTNEALQNTQGAEGIFVVAKANLFKQLASAGGFSMLQVSGLLSDEFHPITYPYIAYNVNIDARRTAAFGGWTESGDSPFGGVLAARSSMLIAAEALAKYEPPTGQDSAAQAFALIGYTELLFAEDYCAGVTLDRTLVDDGIEYGHPLTTDSLFGLAEAHFDTAVAHAAPNSQAYYLASVGLARVRLNRGNNAGVLTALSSVPTDFAYNMPWVSPDYGYKSLYRVDDPCYSPQTVVSDGEGGTGIPYVSAHDPRVPVIDTTCLDYTYAPATYRATTLVKYGRDALYLPIALGVEARLMEAEAEVSMGNAGWLTILNTLRTTCTDAATCPTNAPAGTGGVAGLPPLSDPGNADSSVALVFRERAFWLFGQGTRLGDMRRLIKLHNRPVNTVFPSGAYVGGSDPHYPSSILTYGTDVSITLPTEAGGSTWTNPYYKGCIE